MGAWILSRHGLRWGLSDVPSERSSHLRTTPKGGGIGVALAALLAGAATGVPAGVWGATLAMATLGLAADRFEIRPAIRLIVEFVLAGTAMVALFPIVTEAFFLLAMPLLAVYIVGTANFYNFMDGIDGMAALSGIVAFGLLAWQASLAGIDPAFRWLALAGSLGCLGFLPFNLPIARVFMGDAGSLTLGFLFAVIAVVAADGPLQFACNAGCLLPFYLDELSTMVLRLRDSEPLTRPHRRHLYQILANELAVPHGRVAIGYAVAQAAMGGSILTAARWHPGFGVLLMLFYAVGFSLLTVRVRRRAAAFVRS